MQDRTPTKPNRALVSPEDGSPAFYATITRADEPTQMGDPLNKNTFLKDSTAALFEKDGSATPDDIFKAIGENFINGYPQIGDLRYSVLDKIDDKWRRCDGSLINETEYPILFERLHGDGAGRVLTETNGVLLTDVVCGGGYTVAYEKGGACTCYVTTDPSKGLTSVTLSSTECSDFTICYDDGVWVAFGHSSGAYGKRDITVWTTANPLSSWTNQTTAITFSSNISQYKFVFEYKNKTFLAASACTGYSDTGADGCFVWATKNLNSTWMTSTVTGRSNVTYAPSLVWNNGVWVIACRYKYSNQTGVYVASTTDPANGTKWAEEYSYYDAAKDGPFHLAYFKNYWVLTCNTNIYVTQNLKQWPSSPTKTLSNEPTALVANTEKICCVAGSTLVVATNPAGTWTEVQPVGITAYQDVAFDGDGKMWLVGKNNSSPYFYTEAARKLPNIEVDAAYAYIRAK